MSLTRSGQMRSSMSGMDESLRPVVVDAAVEAVVRALLQFDAVDAARVRDSTPSRRRPRPQSGPSADYGAPE